MTMTSELGAINVAFPGKGSAKLLGQSLCTVCGCFFNFRANKTYCSAKCRKKAFKKSCQRDARYHINTQSVDAKKRKELLYDLNSVLSERLYTMRPEARLGYIEEVLQYARTGACGLLTELLKNKKFQYPKTSNRRMFFRGQPRSYCSFPQACNRYLIVSPHSMYLSQFLQMPEDHEGPHTGEVYGENSVDVGGDGGGWSRVYANHRQKGKALPEYKTKGTLEDPTGHYIHPWYFDGVSHRQGAARALTKALSL